MIEKHFILEEADPVIFYGVNNVNIKMLRALCPKLRIMARDNVVRVMGDEEEMANFEDIFTKLEHHCAKFNNLSEEDILNVIKGHITQSETAQDVIVYSTGGKPITPRSANQRKLVEAYDKCDMIFAIGSKRIRQDLYSYRLSGTCLEKQKCKENHLESSCR